MSTLAESARIEAPVARRRSRPRGAARRRPVAGAVLWIVALGVLLAGVVAINVAVLQLNVRLDELGRDRAQLRADAARLASQLSSAAANARIEHDAQERLGLVLADPAATEYVELRP
jgi:cell division protein FtsL